MTPDYVELSNVQQDTSLDRHDGQDLVSAEHLVGTNTHLQRPRTVTWHSSAVRLKGCCSLTSASERSTPPLGLTLTSLTQPVADFVLQLKGADAVVLSSYFYRTEVLAQEGGEGFPMVCVVPRGVIQMPATYTVHLHQGS